MSDELMKNFRMDMSVASEIMEDTIPMYESEAVEIDPNDNSRIAQKRDLKRIMKSLENLAGKVDGYSETLVYGLKDTVDAILHNRVPNAKMVLKLIMSELADIQLEGNFSDEDEESLNEGTMISGYGGMQESDTAFGAIRKVGNYHVGEAHSDGEHIDIDETIHIGFWDEDENGKSFDKDDNVGDMKKLEKAWDTMLNKIQKSAIKGKTEDGRRYDIHCMYDSSSLEYWLDDDNFMFSFTCSFDDAKPEGLSDKDLKAIEKGFDEVISKTYNIIKGSIKSLDAHLVNGGFMDIMESKKVNKRSIKEAKGDYVGGDFLIPSLMDLSDSAKSLLKDVKSKNISHNEALGELDRMAVSFSMAFQGMGLSKKTDSIIKQLRNAIDSGMTEAIVMDEPSEVTEAKSVLSEGLTSSQRNVFVDYGVEILGNLKKQNPDAGYKAHLMTLRMVMRNMSLDKSNPNYKIAQKFMPKKYDEMLFTNGDDNTYDSLWMSQKDSAHETIFKQALSKAGINESKIHKSLNSIMETVASINLIKEKKAPANKFLIKEEYDDEDDDEDEDAMLSDTYGPMATYLEKKFLPKLEKAIKKAKTFMPWRFELVGMDGSDSEGLKVLQITFEVADGKGHIGYDEDGDFVNEDNRKVSEDKMIKELVDASLHWQQQYDSRADDKNWDASKVKNPSKMNLIIPRFMKGIVGR